MSSSSTDAALVDPAVLRRRPSPSRTRRSRGTRPSGTASRSFARADHVEVGERRLHHHDVGALVDVGRDLAERLVGVRAGPLVARAVAEPRRALGRLAERPVERGRVLRRVGQDRRRRSSPPPSSAARIAPTWPSIIPLGATMWAPASACATAIRRVALERRVVVDLAVGRRARRSGRGRCTRRGTGRRSDARRRRARRAARASACCAIPSGFHASEPSASLRAGTPNSMNASTPVLAISAASLRSDSSVCCDCPGIEAIGTGSVDALLHEQRRDQVPRRELGLADQRPERGGAAHPARPVPQGIAHRRDATAARAPARRRRPGRRPCAGPRRRARAGRARVPRAPSRGRCTRPSGSPSPRPSRARTRARWRRS